LAIVDALAELHFTMSKSDGDFLMEYIRWRMDHPIAN